MKVYVVIDWDERGPDAVWAIFQSATAAQEFVDNFPEKRLELFCRVVIE